MLNAFYPVVAGRTSDALRRTRVLFQLQVDQVALQGLQQQISTGLRYLNVSDDPSSAIRVMGLQSAQEYNKQTQINLTTSQGVLNITEANLSETQRLLNEVKGLSISALDSTLTESERLSIADHVSSVLDRLISLGNTKFQDRTLFSGGKVKSTPLEQVDNKVQFSGNDLDLLTSADLGDYLGHNVTAQRALGVVSEGVTSIVDLNAGVLPSTHLADLNGGRGVSEGAIQFSDGNEVFVLDTANAETLQDLAERINSVALSGRNISATVTPVGLNINFADGNGGVLRVTDIGVGASAAELGIATSTPSPALPIVGSDLDPILRTTTKISQLNNGTGMNLQGGILISQGGKNYRVELAQVETVEELLNKINRSGAAVHADLVPGENRIRVRSFESGSSFSIGESDGDLATRLGLRTFDASTLVSDLNFGRGVNQGASEDLQIGQNDGTRLSIELQGVVTIQDVIDRINNHIDNQAPATKITASLNVKGNGLTLSSPATGAVSPISVGVAGGSEAAWNLGLLPIGSTYREGVIGPSGNLELVGSDPNPQEVKGVYNSLIRLRDSIVEGNFEEMTRSGQMIEDDIGRLSTARGNLGVRQQRIASLQEITDNASLEMTIQESNERDADLAQVISDLSARQAAQEASLKLLSQTSRLSLFDFL